MSMCRSLSSISYDTIEIILCFLSPLEALKLCFWHRFFRNANLRVHCYHRFTINIFNCLSRRMLFPLQFWEFHHTREYSSMQFPPSMFLGLVVSMALSEPMCPCKKLVVPIYCTIEMKPRWLRRINLFHNTFYICNRASVEGMFYPEDDIVVVVTKHTSCDNAVSHLPLEAFDRGCGSCRIVYILPMSVFKDSDSRLLEQLRAILYTTNYNMRL